MSIRKSVALALAALTLSTTMATALVSPALPDPNRCHDETSMRIGTFVDGECRSPAPPLRQGGYDMSWGPYSIQDEDRSPFPAGTIRPAAR